MDVKGGQAARQALREWLKKEQIPANELARRCSSETIKFHAKQILRVLDEDRLPSPQLAAALEKITGVKSDSWEQETPSESERRPVVLRELGSTKVELLETIRLIDLALAGKPSDTALANLAGKRTSALIAISRLEERAQLEDHPDFGPFLEDVIGAVKDALGTDAPDGIEALIADALERRGAARETAKRRAA